MACLVDVNYCNWRYKSKSHGLTYEPFHGSRTHAVQYYTFQGSDLGQSRVRVKRNRWVSLQPARRDRSWSIHPYPDATELHCDINTTSLFRWDMSPTYCSILLDICLKSELNSGWQQWNRLIWNNLSSRSGFRIVHGFLQSASSWLIWIMYLSSR
jgi:hypothetical protein